MNRNLAGLMGFNLEQGREILERFTDPVSSLPLLREIERILPRRVRLMEVCGTHTMALFETGLRSVLANMGIELISGPGCPVCVTSAADIDFAIALTQLPLCTVYTFGDMLRVPGSTTSLEQVKAAGADVRVVYSPLDAIPVSGLGSAWRTVFLGIGFETTAPAAALAVQQAAAARCQNFFLLSCLKTIPAALRALALDPGLALDGFICPGHVSVITGESAYKEVIEKAHLPCVITGFEAMDILRGVLAIVKQIAAGTARVENAYSRVVRKDGNKTALDLIDKIFQPADSEWRGLGVIPGSGLALRTEYAWCDARQLLPEFTAPASGDKHTGCRCGEILKGVLRPDQCSCFATTCTPNSPLGACMVSHEGACRAFYRYRDHQEHLWSR